MILVTLGTQDKSFERLLQALEDKLREGKIKDKVIVQAGYTKFKSKYMEIFDLVEMDEFNRLISECDVLITHGGVGSILTGLTNNKKVIAAARLSKYKEHTNDHQKEIVGEFSRLGYILELDDFSKIDEVIKKVKKFKPKKYESNNENMRKIITDYIEKEDNTSWFNKVSNLIMYGFIEPVTLLLTWFLFYLITLTGLDLLICNIISGLILVFGTYYIYSKDIVSCIFVKYFFNRFIVIGLDTVFLYALVGYMDLWQEKLISGVFIIVLSFLIAMLLKNSCCDEK